MTGWKLPYRSSLLVVVGVVMSGCGSAGEGAANRPERVPVHGVVTLNKQPVKGATVVLIPQEHPHAATGRTDAQGRFQLRTFTPNDGAVPGEYQVTIRKVEMIGVVDEPEGDGADVPPPEQRWLTPERYANAKTSGLTASITTGKGDELTFHLTD